MIINNKSWEKLKEYVDNLYWDEIFSYSINNDGTLLLSNQENIDDLDAVSGSTFSSDALKNMVKKVMEEVNEK